MRLGIPNPTLGLPRVLKRRIVTVNVEELCIRVMMARGGRVVAWRQVPLNEGLVREGVITEPQRVGAALGGALPLLGARVIVGISGFRSIARVLELPKMKASLLEGAVTREAKREMPVPLEDVYLSWQPVDSYDGQQRIFALGVPRDILDPLLKTISVAKRHPYAVDTKPLALARAANRNEAIIADIEPASADIVVVTRGIPIIMRTVVERQDQQNGRERIQRFRDELARTIKFYNDTHRQEPLAPSTPVFLTGSMAQLVLREPLDSVVPYPVEPLMPPLSCPASFPIETYAVNVGLALKEV